jgi:aminocarboxymuconate-semialdehyde decarboxylase
MKTGGTVANRRQFIEDAALATAGIFFARPSLIAAGSRAQQPNRQITRRQVMVGGRRVKTVDVHCHIVVPEAALLMGKTIASTDAGIFGPERIRQMDEQGIDVEAISINPDWYAVDKDLARKIIRLQNEKLAELCAAHPDRFVGLASVALQHPDLAAEQLEEAVTKWKMYGAAIGASVEGEELSSPKFDPFWAKAEALGTMIFIHPQPAPGRPTERLKGSGFLDNVIGNPLETTIGLSHLIFEGTLDRFPRLRICAAHGGGFLPSYSGRADNGCKVRPDNCKGPTLKKIPSEYLKQLYFDSLVFTSEGLRHLVAECGAGQIMMGTDAPYRWTTTSVDHILRTPTLSDADRIAILGGTACKLLRIPTSFPSV